MGSLSVITGHIDYVLLLFIRVSGILTTSPIFGRKNVPNMAKIGFCIVLTLVFMTGLPAPAVYPEFRGLLEYVLACVRELLFGAAMGFILTAMFSIALTAGAIMDYQIGYSMASIYDSQNNTQSPITGSLLNIMLLVMFFALDGHLKLIGMLYKTFETVPVGFAAAVPDILKVTVKVAGSSLLMSLMVAMPVLAAGIIVEIALGAMIKTVPQMNMFVVGIPIKIIVGLIMLLITITLFADFSKNIFNAAFNYISEMFSYMSGLA